MVRFLLSRLRVGAIFVSFLAVFAAPQSWGLGLGEIELNSALNQEFKASIELFDASGLEPGEIIVSLGSSEDFQRIGVERFFFLTDLSFEVVYGPTGNPQVNVTSNRPITEPYLNFLVEILWPSGRMLKEYTVLLDPPTFSEAAAPAVSAPQQNRSASNSGRVQRVQPAQSGTQVQVAPKAGANAEPSALDRGLSGDEYGMTDRDDTLWSIASRARPSNAVSVNQTMLAIQELNPEAFINGNINLLKAGYVLRLPDEAQARSLSTQEAIGEVARHEAEWRAYNNGDAIADRGPRPAAAAADATSDLRSPADARDATTSATEVAATEGELRVVAEDGDSTTGVGQLAAAGLDAALEETDRLGRQVDELTYQIDREKELANTEISVRDRQIEVRDQQIAELQAQLAAAQQQASQVAAAEPDPQNQNQSTQAEAAAPWWQSPVVMYGGAGVLVLLLVGGMLTARKRRSAEAENDYFDADEAFAEEERVEPKFADFDNDEQDDDDATVVQSAEEDFEEELQGSQTSDVIGEADIYIAYGRFPQAIGLLLGVLEDEPERNDVRMKLLEVYAESGDRAAFDQHMTSLIEYCDDEEALLSARELGNQFGEEAITLDEMMADEQADPVTDSTADTDSVGDLEFATDNAPSAETAEEDLVLDLESQPEAGEAEDGRISSALDFELELDELDTTDQTQTIETGEDSAAASAPEVETSGAGDELGGDLGIDFDPDAADSTDTPEKLDNGIEFQTSELAAAELPTQDAASADEASDNFTDAEELTIDAVLEEAAASISSEAADVDAAIEEEGDLVVEALAEPDTVALDDFEFESVAQAEDDFEFEDEGDSANTKLDLARAYIDMGDADGARDILKEVLDEGNSDQQQKAQAMLDSL